MPFQKNHPWTYIQRQHVQIFWLLTCFVWSALRAVVVGAERTLTISKYYVTYQRPLWGTARSVQWVCRRQQRAVIDRRNYWISAMLRVREGQPTPRTDA